jgi:hypothetical protein
VLGLKIHLINSLYDNRQIGGTKTILHAHVTALGYADANGLEIRFFEMTGNELEVAATQLNYLLRAKRSTTFNTVAVLVKRPSK